MTTNKNIDSETIPSNTNMTTNKNIDSETIPSNTNMTTNKNIDSETIPSNTNMTTNKNKKCRGRPIQWSAFSGERERDKKQPPPINYCCPLFQSLSAQTNCFVCRFRIVEYVVPFVN